MGISKACWQSFVDWLEAGAPGTSPARLRWTLGPVWRLVPQARQAAQALGPWLVSLLEARQRAGLALFNDAEVIRQDLEARPLTRAEAAEDAQGWAQWQLEAELLRLVRLVEAPTPLLYRAEWVAWEVRYWAVVITLARIRQRYGLLGQQRIEPEERLWAAAEAIWQRALHPEPVAA